MSSHQFSRTPSSAKNEAIEQVVLAYQTYLAGMAAPGLR